MTLYYAHRTLIIVYYELNMPWHATELNVLELMTLMSDHRKRDLNKLRVRMRNIGLLDNMMIS